MEAQKQFVTKKGFEKIKREFEILREMKMSKIKNELPKATVSEDISAEYLSYYEDLGLMEIKLSRLENILKNVAIIRPPRKEGRDIVDLGAIVRVEIQGEKDEFEITGSLEANPAIGKISTVSPVGAALLGHRVGDLIEVLSPIKTLYRILSIDYQIA